MSNVKPFRSFSRLLFGIVIAHSSYVLNAKSVTICPSKEFLPVRDIVFNYVCNYSLICDSDNDLIFGTNLQKTVIIYSDKESRLKTTNFINNFSKCSKHPLLQVTSANSTRKDEIFSSICSSNIISTLIIDVTDVGKSFKENQNVNDCWKYDVIETDQSIYSIFAKCNLMLLIKHFTCDNNDYHQSVFQVSNEFKNVMKNKTIRITPSTPSSLFITSNDTHIYAGMLFEMMKKLKDNLGFNYTIVPPINEDYGSVVNGSWNGLIGMLVRKETDVVLADLTVTYGRSTVMDFSIPYYNEPMGIIVQNSNINKSLLRLIQLFTPTVWALYLCSIFIAIFTIWALRKHTLVDGDSGVETLAASGWYVFSAQVNQDAERNIQAWSGRIFEIVWRIVAFIVIATYTGGFVADLTTSRIKVPFKNLAELVTAAFNGDIKICVARNNAFTTAVMRNDSGSYQGLRKWLLENPNYYVSDEKCKQLVMNNTNVAYLTQKTSLDILQKEGCEQNKTLIILDDYFFYGFYALGFQQNSPYNDIISSEISNFVDSGLVDKWYKRNSKEMPFCKIFKPGEILDGSSEGLSMVQIGGAFIVLGFGFVVSIIRFLYETYQIHIWMKKNSRNVENHQ